ncbi:MAG: hypothetical protein P4M07_13365 [Xanthobacteraceae bacterium]|nr:hypothetical protein [Xanthobacteraceae bacterium]
MLNPDTPSHGLTVVTSCLGCETHANLTAAVVLIAAVAVFSWIRERRTAPQSRPD